MKHKDAISRMQKESITICEYCGKTKEGLSFVIGASRKADWMMVFGTGKMTCPDCWEKARAEGEAAVDKHVQQNSGTTKKEGF